MYALTTTGINKSFFREITIFKGRKARKPEQNQSEDLF